jgi:hypothetical protein
MNLVQRLSRLMPWFWADGGRCKKSGGKPPHSKVLSS